MKEKKTAKLYALRLLNVKPMPTAQLRTKLEKREYPEAVINEVIEECTESGYLNDTEWAHSYARCNLARKYGIRRIAQKLQLKGLDPVLIEEIIETHSEKDKIYDAITTLLSTKYAKRNLSDHKERQKVIASLVRRGFNYEDILNSLQYREFDS